MEEPEAPVDDGTGGERDREERRRQLKDRSRDLELESQEQRRSQRHGPEDEVDEHDEETSVGNERVAHGRGGRGYFPGNVGGASVAHRSNLYGRSGEA